MGTWAYSRRLCYSMYKWKLQGTRFLKQLDHNLQRCCSYEVSQYRFLLN